MIYNYTSLLCTCIFLDSSCMALDLKSRVEHYPTVESDLRVGSHDASKCATAERKSSMLLDFVICIDDKESDARKYNYFSNFYLIGLLEQAHKHLKIAVKYAPDARDFLNLDHDWRDIIISALKNTRLTADDYCTMLDPNSIEECKKDQYYVFN